MARLFHCILPSRRCRLRSQPSTRAWLETAERLCESDRRWNGPCPARLRQDFAAQTTPAGPRGHCLNGPRAADNDARNRILPCVRRSHSNDDLCAYSEAPVAIRRNIDARHGIRCCHLKNIWTTPHTPASELSPQMTTSTTSIDIIGLQATYANLQTDPERAYFMQRYHGLTSVLGGKAE